jgi:translation elongation factor EF-1alpha
VISSILDENDKEVFFAQAGESIKIVLKNINYDDIRRGDVICGGQYWTMECQEFVAEVNLFEIP